MDNLDFFDSSIVIRGRSYFRNKEYEISSIDENHIDASVFGNETYKVHLSFKDDGRLDINKSYCTCPCSYPCKHMACMVLAYEEKNKNAKNIPANQDYRIKGLISRGEDTLRYLTNTYSATAYVSSAINELQKQWKNISNENKDKLCIIIFKILEKYTYSENYYSSYYEEPDTLFERLVECINDNEKAESLLLNSLYEAKDIKIGFLDLNLKKEHTKTMLQNALIKVFYEKKEGLLQEKITMQSHSLPTFDITLIPDLIRLDFLKIFYPFVSNKSKVDLINETFSSNGKEKILSLANILLANEETNILNKNDIAKLDQIDHKLALQCILKMANSTNLSWITFYKSFSKEEDKLENNVFEKEVTNVIDGGNPAPKLIFKNCQIDFRKVSVNNVFELLDCTEKEHYQKITEFLFKKIEKDFTLKTKKPDEIALGLLCLDYIDDSLSKKLVLNEKCFEFISESEKASMTYFELLNKYELLNKVGYEIYGE